MNTFLTAQKIFTTKLWRTVVINKSIRFQHNVVVKMQNRKSNRGCKIISFNRPYSYSVATDVGKTFFLLLDKHFPRTHMFYKIFNWNNVKVSYSQMLNISSIIKSHNKMVLSNDRSKSSNSFWNCRDKSSCPLYCNYLQQNVVYCSKLIPRN